jgi:uncharacterized protein YegL
MKENFTEIVSILDRSGSMSGLTQDTIGGFNTFIGEQKLVPGNAAVTTVLFDDKYEVLHNGVNLNDILPITEKDYSARGCTALLDAVGKTVNSIGEKLSRMPEQERPSKVIFLIITDGMENASQEFTHAQIKEMIERQKNIYKWEFLFFGANIDSFGVSGSRGIDSSMTANFSATGQGIKAAFVSACYAMKCHRTMDKIPEDFQLEAQ